MKSLYLTIIWVSCVLQLPVQGQYVQDAARFFSTNLGYGGADLALAGSSGTTNESFGSILQNPAAAALFNESQLSLGIGTFRNDAEARYLSSQFDDTQRALALDELAMVYKFPTLQGSFAISAGYQQTQNFRRGHTAQAFNSTNSISDFYANATSSDLRLIGYNGYATDSVQSSSNGLQSILRFGNQFQGINQLVEMNETGQMGEFHFTVATEFVQNIFAGFTVGIPLGTYSQERIIYEQDQQNAYTSTPFDVSTILATDNLTASIAGIYAKLGLIFRPNDLVSVGLTYQTPTILSVEETFSSRIETRFDDNFGPSDDFPYQLDGEFDYQVMLPQMLEVQFSARPFKQLRLTGAVEYLDYSAIEFQVDNEFIGFELEQNQAVASQLTDVVRLKGGLSYQFDSFQPMIGIARLPGFGVNSSDFQTFGSQDMTLFSGGVTFNATEQLSITLAGQYFSYDAQTTVYEVPSDLGISPVLEETRSRLQFTVSAAIRF